jgi:hypothetical protein
MLVRCLVMIALSLPVAAQERPHVFKLDTPPIAGQIQETPREKLGLSHERLGDEHIALPTSGPKAPIEVVEVEN